MTTDSQQDKFRRKALQVPDAQGRILPYARRLPAETVALPDAQGRILAERVTAPIRIRIFAGRGWTALPSSAGIRRAAARTARLCWRWWTRSPAALCLPYRSRRERRRGL